MAEQYKLHYFDARGVAEPLRLILSYGGAKWEDNRFPVELPTPTIPAEVKAIAPYGQVPLLEVNGEVMSQSASMGRYLARKFKLVGATELESAKCDEIVDAAKDVVQMFSPVIREQDEAKKAEMKAKAVTDAKTKFLSKFNSLLETNGGRFVGKSLTWADIVVASFIDNLQRTYQVQLTEDLPELEKLTGSVFNEPGIKEWIAKRPNTPF